MRSQGFQALHQNDDYMLDGVHQQSTHHSDHNQTFQPAHTPSRWESVKSAYNPKVTYVALSDLPRVEKSHRQRPQSGRRKSSRFSLLGNPVSNLRIPQFAAPWQHEQSIGLPSQGPSTVRYFDRSKQLRRTFVNGFLQWLLTLGLVVCEFAVLYGFSRQPTVSKAEVSYTHNSDL